MERQAMADWDSFSDRFDDVFLKDPLYIEILNRMAAELDADDKEILDLGCGTGNLMELILEEIPKIHLTGLDPSAGMRDACAKRFEGSDRVSISGGEALALPFPDASFDAVVSSLALHHVPRQSKGDCAEEIARVLRPGGKFIHSDAFCGVAGPKEDPERCRDIIEKIVAKMLFSLEHGAYEMMLAESSSLLPFLREDGEYLITMEEWLGELRAAGFRDFRVIDLQVELTKIIIATWA
jgi:ubiquinone/menaquinone biosynthesis C-methylase UbiE